ncbi:MAG: hypothetical protein KKD28_14415 [Chloroflexi bacterium]|nr:hypothetical protein [Chloroflexota bacterium]
MLIPKRLSPLDKVRLIEWVVPDIERELQSAQPVPRKSLRGIWSDLDITDEDIAEVRREMWANFPREDI